MRKLIATSEGKFIGTHIGSMLDKILRKKKGSDAYKRSLIERNHLINRALKYIEWNQIEVIGYENLKNMKKGKKGFRTNVGFRNRQKYWTYGKVKIRIVELAQQNRVLPVFNNPRHSSSQCPACSYISADNRCNEHFDCLTCGYKQDADTVGAINMVSRTMKYLRCLESRNKKLCCYI